MMKVAHDPKEEAEAVYGFCKSALARNFDSPRPTPPLHLEMWEYFFDPAHKVAIAAPRSHAKAQPLSSKVLTPTGWTTIGELVPGDLIIGGDGKTKKVIATHPISRMNFMRITLRDGRSTLCNGDHLWVVRCPSNQPGLQIKSLDDIESNYRTVRNDGNIECRYKIPSVCVKHFTHKDFCIDPYTLGAWLGDGHSAGGRFTTADKEILSYFPYKTEKQSGKYGYVIREIYPKLKSLGVLNNKHIPSEFLLGSLQQRLELLQGLMDTDGTCHKDGNIAYFCNTKKCLVESVAELIRSLGGVAVINENWTNCNGKRFQSWRVSCKLPHGINPFRLQRKFHKWAGSKTTEVYISDISQAGVGLGRCITVEGDTYITDDYILTHNSTAVTHVCTLYSVLFRLHDHVMIISDTEDQATAFLKDINMELQENEKLQALFGPFKFYKDSEKEVIVGLPDGHRFRIIARGAQTSLRGLKWRHKRPNLIIGDDLENDESVMNEERRTKFKRWFFSALMQAVAPEARVRLVGTILHFDSLLESLMPPTSGDDMDNTVTDGLRQYSKNPKRSWKSIKYRAHTDFNNFSEILWPEMFTEEILKAKRQDFIDQGFPEGYAQEWLNYPIAEDSAFFRKDDLKAMEQVDYEREEKGMFRYYAAVDPAISSKEKRSYTAIIVVGEDHNHILHVIKVIRGRYDSKEIIDKMISVQRDYCPELFIVERGIIEKSLGPFLKDEMHRTGVYINIHKVTPTKDKMTRARAIQGRIRQHGVRFDKKAEWWPALYEELIRFDRGEYDDQVDALAWIGLVLNELLPGRTRKEMEDEEYEDEMYKSDLWEEGRSEMTGY